MYQTTQQGAERTEPTLGHFKMFIDGRWVEAADGATLAIVDPASEEVVATVANGGPKEAALASEAARHAFDQGPWPRMSTVERATYLTAAARKVRERVDQLARLETLQMGKLIGVSTDEMAHVAELLEYASGIAQARAGEQLNLSQPPSFAAVAREPVGVVAGITPWNFPLDLAAWKFAPALAVGNVIIVKPASVSPLTTIEMARIFDEVGLPEGVFQVIVGPGGTVGEHLSSSPLVDMVTLTGSLEVGRCIMRNAADTIKKVGLELGGKSPNIVFADADFEAAIQGALMAAFFNTGQVCCAGTRLLLERSIHDDFVAELVRRARAMKVGPGVDPTSQMGPLSSANQLATTERYVALGLQEGATLACGGHRLGSKGYFYEPTIFTAVSNTMRIAQEEIFGPVLCVIPFETEAEAIHIANDTIYGLAGGVWTKDTAKAMRVVQALRAGTVWVNTYNWSPHQLPWGGYKQSGVGRELGSLGLDEFTEAKSIIVDTSGKPMGFCPAS